MLNNNLNFMLRGSNEISGIETNKILNALDLIEVLVKKEQVIQSFDPSKFAILKPIHCLIGETNNSIIIGLTNSNVVLGMQSVATLNKTIPASNPEEFMRRVMENDFNGTLDGYIEIDKIFFLNYGHILSEIEKMEESRIFLEINSNPELVNDLNVIALKYISKYNKEENELKFNPIFKARELQVDEKLVFCILPFDDDRLEIFTDIIRKELEDDFDLKVIRADDIFSNQDIMEDIWTYICKARFIIADISLKNPNVFYELGICHTVGKEVITICDEYSLENDYNGKLPFDISSRRTIFYKNSGAGPQKMTEELKKHVEVILDNKNIQQ